MAPGGSVYWVAQRMLEETTDKAIGILRLWTHDKRQEEATEEMVALINDLSDTDAIRALNQLQEPKQYVCFSGPHKEQLDLDIRIQTIANNCLFPTKALLDCRSTGSCVNQKFVKKNGLTTCKAVVLIKTYNADGSLNQ